MISLPIISAPTPQHINSLPSLRYAGLMTIGKSGDMSCFDRLKSLHDAVGGEVLSMGMSGDYEEAVERGATEVRCGSNIFGARDYPAKN